jgi:phosphoribosylaminoimidazole carboxylase (NCAIR synthetase)
MHRYLVISMTNRGKYTVTGFVIRAQAEAHLRAVLDEPATYEARLVDLD